MSHFKYEINERQLRLQLREHTVSIDEDAWRKFESFSANQKNNSHDSGMKKFNISLNRNVVLPAVFGMVIILFSLLLFNFVNIKNPDLETADVQAAEPVLSEPVMEKKVEPAKFKKVVPLIKDSAVTAPTEEIITTQPDLAENSPQTEIEADKKPDLAVETKSPENSKSTESATTQSNNNSINHVEAPRKKRVKRQLIVTEPTVAEEDLTPPPVSQASSTTPE